MTAYEQVAGDVDRNQAVREKPDTKQRRTRKFKEEYVQENAQLKADYSRLDAEYQEALRAYADLVAERNKGTRKNLAEFIGIALLAFLAGFLLAVSRTFFGN